MCTPSNLTARSPTFLYTLRLAAHPLNPLKFYCPTPRLTAHPLTLLHTFRKLIKKYIKAAAPHPSSAAFYFRDSGFYLCTLPLLILVSCACFFIELHFFCIYSYYTRICFLAISLAIGVGGCGLWLRLRCLGWRGQQIFRG